MSQPQKRRVVLLGSTGSIGVSTLRVAQNLPDYIEIIAMAAGTNAIKLAEQACEFGVQQVAIFDESKTNILKESVSSKVAVHSGEAGLVHLAQLEEADIVLIAIVGTAGLLPALAAIEAGKDIAVASKEILVMAGHIITQRAAEMGVRILPVDSEHNAIFQCLEGHRGPKKEVSKLILTASGGPFRNTPAADLWDVTLAMALRHPTWNMGPKISIDSASLFNKGLEMIEARWLFDIPMDRIEAIIHPQSIIHSMVEYNDGSVLAQLCSTDMGFPIQYALTYPQRFQGDLKRLDFTQISKLEFATVRSEDFPALRLAREAGMACGTMPAVFNAANEVAVEFFRAEQIRFPHIWACVSQCMKLHLSTAYPTLTDILTADQSARAIATSWCQENLISLE